MVSDWWIKTTAGWGEGWSGDRCASLRTCLPHQSPYKKHEEGGRLAAHSFNPRRGRVATGRSLELIGPASVAEESF